MTGMLNPYDEADSRHEVWELAVRRDIEAFVAGDWERISGDFVEHGFFGIDAGGDARPATWQLRYPSLENYRARWLEQSQDFRSRCRPEEAVPHLARLLTVARLELNDESGVLLKRFDGAVPARDGVPMRLSWESLFVLRREASAWKIAAFVGYLPVGFA